MNDTVPVWIMYFAQYDVGRQHARIIPDSIGVLRASYAEISNEQLERERERTGLGYDLYLQSVAVPAATAQTDLVSYLTGHLTKEPEFDFWDEVIGDDIVVDGVVYDDDLYTYDGEDVVLKRDDIEHDPRNRDLADTGESTAAADPAPPKTSGTDDTPADPIGLAVHAKPGTPSGPPHSRLGRPPGTAGSRHAGTAPVHDSARRR
jgi:hypothetical protein